MLFHILGRLHRCVHWTAAIVLLSGSSRLRVVTPSVNNLDAESENGEDADTC